MARTIPSKGYGGIYGEEAAGKVSSDMREQRTKDAANDFANAEKFASRDAPKVNDKTTSSSTDVAENGGAGYSPAYNSGKAAGGTAASVAKATPMGRLARAFRRKSDGQSRKPFLTAGGITGIVALSMFISSSFLQIHTIFNLVDLRDSMSTVMHERGQRIIRRIVGRDNADAYSTWARRNHVSPRRME